jgi:hypothetical protein
MRWATLKEIAFYIMIVVLLVFMVLGFFHPITPQIPKMPGPALSNLIWRGPCKRVCGCMIGRPPRPAKSASKRKSIQSVP